MEGRVRTQIFTGKLRGGKKGMWDPQGVAGRGKHLTGHAAFSQKKLEQIPITKRINH